MNLTEVYKNRIQELAGINFDLNNRMDILKAIDRAYQYKTQVIDLKIPTKFLDKSIKKYTEQDYNVDLDKLRNFDINLLWDKSFWNIGVSSSISAIASGPYTKLKKLLML
jgi:hypothetical protein